MEKICLHNRWDIVATNIKTGEVKKYEGQNIILNQFWTKYISSSNNATLAYIHIGEGTDAPVATNTKLKTPFVSYVSANRTTDLSHWDADGYIIVQLSCRIEANTYVGKIVAEVGFAYSGTTSGNLVTHSLIKDMNGNPTTHEIIADEYLDVYGTVYFKIPKTLNPEILRFDYIPSNTVSIMPRLLCERAHATLTIDNAGFSKFVRGVKYYLVNQMIETGYASSVAYDAANKKVTYSMVNLPVGSGNIEGGIASIVLGMMLIRIPCNGFAQPAITKEVVGTGDGTVKDFATAFGQILNNSIAKAYINDVEVSATFDYEVPSKTSVTNVVPYMNVLETSDNGFYTSASGSNGGITTGYLLFENPYYQSFGLTSGYGNEVQLQASNDLTTWYDCGSRHSTAGAFAITSTYKNYRYFRAKPYAGEASGYLEYVSSSEITTKTDVHLASIPANGDTIAVTYQPNVIAKTSDRTLKDMSFVFTFAEYTPA